LGAHAATARFVVEHAEPPADESVVRQLDVPASRLR
jgi:hypothetical protein